MRIAIIAPGSQGDVQPYIALGQGLKNAGHTVRFVTHSNFEDHVQPHGLEFWPMGGNVQEIVQTDEMRERVEKGNFIRLMALMAKEARRAAVSMAEGGLAACKGMDMILTGMGGLFIGVSLAEKLDLPLLQAYVVPFTPTRYFSSALTPGLPRPLNRLSHHLMRQFMWQGLRSADTLARREVLGIPGAPLDGPYNSERTRGLPILYGFSPAVIAPPPDWDKNIHVTGYWLPDSAEGWNPSPELVNFLEAGPPPVYVGFGSMSNRKPEETADLVLTALKQTNQRAILFSGWGGLHKSDLPASIFMTDFVPHSWLFPRVAAVVHHGGASTTAAGLRAGIPSTIVPFFGDQPFWGRIISDLGVGPRPIARSRLTVDRLANAIHRSVSDMEMRLRAAALGTKIQAEDGIGRAVEIIQKIQL